MKISNPFTISFILLLAFRFLVISNAQQHGRLKTAPDKAAISISQQGSSTNIFQFEFGAEKRRVPASRSRSNIKRHTRALNPDRLSYPERSEHDDAEIANKMQNYQERTYSRRNRQTDGISKIATSEDDDEIKLPEGYSVYEIPKDKLGSPLPLYIHAHVHAILDVDELNEEIKLDLEFKVMWTDHKILYHYNNGSKDSVENEMLATIDTLTPEEIKKRRKVLNNPLILEKIWKPNLFIEKLLSVRQPAVMARPLTMRYIPELGWFEYITRISVKLDCEMTFYYYPADTQVCDFSIRGFSYNQDNLNLNWYQNGAYLDDLELPSFDVQIAHVERLKWVKINGLYTNLRKEPDEIFDLLRFRVAARRRLSYHLVQTYLASTFYIIITCLCFLLPSKMVEARVGISMTTLLTLTAMFASVRESTPIVSYVKAIDVWMVGCIFFVFLTLVQFTFYIWLRATKEEYLEKTRRKKEQIFDILVEQVLNRRKSSARNVAPSSDNSEIDNHKGERSWPYTRHHQHKEEEGEEEEMQISSNLKKRFEIYEMLANLIDTYSFILFISIFAVYTTVYWSWLLTKADYFHWDVNSTLNNVDGDGDY